MSSVYKLLADAEWAQGHHDYDVAIFLLQRAIAQQPEDVQLRSDLCKAHEEKARWITHALNLVDVGVPSIIGREIARSLGELAHSDQFRSENLRREIQSVLGVSMTQLDEWVAASATDPPDAMARAMDDGDPDSRLHCCALLLMGTADRPLVPVGKEPTKERLSAGLLEERTIEILHADASLKETFSRYMHHCVELAGPWPDHVFTVSQRFFIIAWRSGHDEIFFPEMEGHVRLCVEYAREALAAYEPDLKFARKFAEQAKNIIEKLKVNPSLEADLLMVDGGISFEEDLDSILPALVAYRKALVLKRLAAAPDTEKVAAALHRMVTMVIDRHYRTSEHPALYGNAATDLESALDAVRELGETDLVALTGLALVRRYGLYSQNAHSEKLARSLLEDPTLPGKYTNDIRLELALAICRAQSVVFDASPAANLSRQNKLEEAYKLFEELLLEESFLRETPTLRSVLLLNLGSVLSRLGKEEKAAETLRAALAVLPPDKDQSAELELKIRGSLSSSLAALGDTQGALGELRHNIHMLTDLAPGPTRLEVARGLADMAFKAKLEEPALCALAIGRSELHRALFGCRDISAWANLLANYSQLDGYSVELLSGRDDDASHHDALWIAEQSKGRLTDWLYHYFQFCLRAPPAGYWDEQLREKEAALRGVDEWVKNGEHRYAVSFYHASLHRGLGIMIMDSSGAIHPRWFPEIDDGEMSMRLSEWQAILANLCTRDSPEWETANRMLEDVLDKVGSLLVATHPAIAEGGEALLLSSHRYLRMYPLSHIRFPNGKRLDKLYGRVHIVPSFVYLNGRTDEAAFDRSFGTEVVALANSDGTLPFAELEAYHCAGMEGTYARELATRNRLRDAFLGHHTVLFSCHARFFSDNPFYSYLQVADAKEDLNELLKLVPRENPPLVVLAACESGLARSNISDEMDGFVPLLFMRGVDTIMAPLWKVDDFSSFLFMTHFFDLLRGELLHSMYAPQQAAQQTAQWLRELTAQKALEALDQAQDLLDKLAEAIPFESQLRIEEVLANARGWLTKKARHLPFGSPLDWAAYQLISAPGGNEGADNETSVSY